MGLPDLVWGHTIFHAEWGVVTLENLLEDQVNHVQKHIAQLKANCEQWRLQPQRQAQRQGY
jgi:hypothetical protein